MFAYVCGFADFEICIGCMFTLGNGHRLKKQQRRSSLNLEKERASLFGKKQDRCLVASLL